MKLLRKTIRKMLLEVYKLSPEEAKRHKEQGSERATGLQIEEEQIEDRKMMQDFNMLLNTTPEGKKVRQQFRTGDDSIQVLHSITYFGIYTSRNINWKKLFSTWIDKIGIRGNNAISCVAINSPIGENPDPWDVWKSKKLEFYNVETVLDGCGFVMKGYPSYIATTDAMTHTLSALIPTAKEHWKESGMVKRPDDWSFSIDFENWSGSDEVILDNWEIIGIYIGDDAKSYDYDAIIADAMSLKNKFGLRVYTVEGGDQHIGGKLKEI